MGAAGLRRGRGADDIERHRPGPHADQLLVGVRQRIVRRRGARRHVVSRAQRLRPGGRCRDSHVRHEPGRLGRRVHRAGVRRPGPVRVGAGVPAPDHDAADRLVVLGAARRHARPAAHRHRHRRRRRRCGRRHRANVVDRPGRQPGGRRAAVARHHERVRRHRDPEHGERAAGDGEVPGVHRRRERAVAAGARAGPPGDRPDRRLANDHRRQMRQHRLATRPGPAVQRARVHPGGQLPVLVAGPPLHQRRAETRQTGRGRAGRPPASGGRSRRAGPGRLADRADAGRVGRLGRDGDDPDRRRRHLAALPVDQRAVQRGVVARRPRHPEAPAGRERPARPARRRVPRPDRPAPAHGDGAGPRLPVPRLPGRLRLRAEPVADALPDGVRRPDDGVVHAGHQRAVPRPGALVAPRLVVHPAASPTCGSGAAADAVSPAEPPPACMYRCGCRCPPECLRVQVLLRRQQPVQAVDADELVVRAVLDDDAVLQDVDLVGVLDGRQAVRDRDRGSAPGGLVQRRLDDLLGRGVQRRRRLVQQQDARLQDDGPGDRDALLLPARQLPALGANVRGVPVGHGRDKVVDVGVAGGLLDLRLRHGRRVGHAQQDVVLHRHVEQRRLLRHDRHDLAQRPQVDRRHVAPVDQDLPGLHVVEALDEADGRRLAAPAGADQRDVLPRLHRDRQAAKDAQARARRVLELDVLELDQAGRVVVRGDDGRRRRVGDERRARQQAEDVARVQQRLGQVGHHAEDAPGRLAGEDDGHQHGEHALRRVPVVDEQVPAERERDRVHQERHRFAQGEQDGAVDRVVLADGERLDQVAAVQVVDVLLARQRRHRAHGADRLAGDLRRLLVVLLGGDVALAHHVHALLVAGDDQRQAGQDDERQLPARDQRDEGGADDPGAQLEHGAERRPRHVLDLGRRRRQRRGQRADRVARLVEPANLLAQHRLQAPVAYPRRQLLAADAEERELEVVAQEAGQRDDEEHEGPEVRVGAQVGALLVEHLEDAPEDVGERRHDGAADDGAQQADRNVPGLGRVQPQDLPHDGEAAADKDAVQALLGGGGGVDDDGRVAAAGDLDGVRVDLLGVVQVDVRPGRRQAGPGHRDGLRVDQAPVHAGVHAHQRLVRALLDDAALVHDDNLVGVADRAEAVRDHERRAPLRRLVQRLLDDALAVRVQRRRRLVQQQQARVLHDAPGDRDALLLPARQQQAAFADLRVVPVGQLADEVVGVRLAARVDDQVALALRRQRLQVGADQAVGHVLGDGRLEQGRLLRHVPDLGAQPAHVQGAHVDAVQLDGAAVRLVEALEQLEQGGLARPGRPDQGAGLAGRDVQVEVDQRGLVRPRRVPEADLAGADGPVHPGGLRAALAVDVDGRHAVDRLVERRGGADGEPDVLQAAAGAGDGERPDQDGHVARDDVARRQVAVDQQRAAVVERQAVHVVDDELEHAEHDAGQQLLLDADALGVEQHAPVQRQELGLGRERTHGPDGGERLLGDVAGQRVLVEAGARVDHDPLAEHADQDAHGGDGADQDERQLPRLGERDDERRHERAEVHGQLRHLLADPVLDHLRVGDDPGADRPAALPVKVRDVLPQRRLQVRLAQAVRARLRRVRPARHVRVRADGQADAQVDKVEHLGVQVRLQLRVRFGAAPGLLPDLERAQVVGQAAEHDRHQGLSGARHHGRHDARRHHHAVLPGREPEQDLRERHGRAPRRLSSRRRRRRRLAVPGIVGRVRPRHAAGARRMRVVARAEAAHTNTRQWRLGPVAQLRPRSVPFEWTRRTTPLLLLLLLPLLLPGREF